MQELYILVYIPFLLIENMPTIYIKKQEKHNDETQRYVSEGIVESEFHTTLDDADTMKISGDFSSTTTYPHTKSKVEVEESSTTE